MVEETLKCFKTYDVRGRIGSEFNEDIAYRIGRATAQSLCTKNVVVGFDARETSPNLAQAVVKGICDAGSNVFEIGLVGTEETYSAVSELDACAGIEVTASHNPIEYNGLKIVKEESQPLTSEEFSSIKKLVRDNVFYLSQNIGSAIKKSVLARELYLDKLISFIDPKNLRPLRIVINSGNGAAGPVVEELKRRLEALGVETHFIHLNDMPDSSFPKGIPNPMLEENRSATSYEIVKAEADFGVAFDGDFDRCFIFDHLGNFISGEYLVGIIAEVFLNRENAGTVIHDPRLIWNTKEIVSRSGGRTVVSKTGHAFVKLAMRKEAAIYGGEISAHHYFRDFYYCDSGMIPWLLIWEFLSRERINLAELIVERKNRFPSSGEINFSVIDTEKCIQNVKNVLIAEAINIDELDGLSMSFDDWRFNLRKSNTEPLVRLNIETKGDEVLLKNKKETLTNLIVDG